jgi:hypothetical protein
MPSRAEACQSMHRDTGQKSILARFGSLHLIFDLRTLENLIARAEGAALHSFSTDFGVVERLAYCALSRSALATTVCGIGAINMAIRVCLLDHPALSQAFHAKRRSASNYELLSFHYS